MLVKPRMRTKIGILAVGLLHFLGGLTASSDVCLLMITACHVSLAWTPEKFDYPDITPCADALVDIKPILYRPFRWGEYQCVPFCFVHTGVGGLVEATLFALRS